MSKVVGWREGDFLNYLESIMIIIGVIFSDITWYLIGVKKGKTITK
ncbi:MAG TPA: hypothetical protein VEU72_07440 [Nitrosopumilaceae archaeon]|nr:hypothetical protein [Nitrosopumilaceae archaeon]